MGLLQAKSAKLNRIMLSQAIFTAAKPETKNIHLWHNQQERQPSHIMALRLSFL